MRYVVAQRFYVQPKHWHLDVQAMIDKLNSRSATQQGLYAHAEEYHRQWDQHKSQQIKACKAASSVRIHCSNLSFGSAHTQFKQFPMPGTLIVVRRTPPARSKSKDNAFTPLVLCKRCPCQASVVRGNADSDINIEAQVVAPIFFGKSILIINQIRSSLLKATYGIKKLHSFLNCAIQLHVLQSHITNM